MSSSRDEVGGSAASLPSVTDLRQRLGYLDSQSPFNDDIRSFRKKYSTRSGLSGVMLHDWKSPEHQAGLSDMTDAFLDTCGNGNLYFPDKTSQGSSNLCYSEDHEKIKWLVKVLFFRLNQQQFRNNKYKIKRKGTPGTADEPINEDDERVDSIEAGTTTVVPTAISNTPSSARPGADLIDPALQDHQYNPASDRENSDIYTYTESNKPPRIHSEVNAKSQGTETADSAPPDRQRKLVKLYTRRHGSKSIFTSRNRPPPETPRRRSARRTRPLRDPEFLYGFDLGSAITPPTPVVESTDTGTTLRNAMMEPRESQHNPVEGGPVNGIGSPAPLQHGTPFSTGIAMSVVHNENIKPLDSTTFSLTPSRDPSTSSTPGLLEQSRQPSEQTNPPKQPSKPSINISYRVVLSRTPKTRWKPWCPNGKFMEKSLSQLLRELDLGQDVKKLAFILTGAGQSVEYEVSCDTEGVFERMKDYFNGLIRDCLRKRAGETWPLTLMIEIEPLNDRDSARCDGADVDAPAW